MEYPLVFAVCNDGVLKPLINCIDGNRAYKDYPIMQFTGLHDKNGVEIYEGDIVSWSAWKLGSCYEKSCKKKVNIVEWSSNKGKWFIGNDLWDLGIYSDIEIIGNIHDNPELLEKKQ
jgi:uncharacterized phage protein (TIGR01671 family)